LLTVFPGERDVESVEDDPDDIPLPSVPAVAVPANPGFGYLPNFYGFFPDFDLVSRIKGLCSLQYITETTIEMCTLEVGISFCLVTR
jgi:hypothetical protein